MDIEKVTLIAPCYNEEEVLREFHQRAMASLIPVADEKFEIIYINDGSTDGTAGVLNGFSEEDPRVKILHLARNHGHQAAITAGLDFATGDVIIIMDSDLQDPPEQIPIMLDKVKEGYDVVHMQRNIRVGETPFKLLTSWSFYKLMKHFSSDTIIENCGDFRAFTRPVLRALSGFREPHRFMRGIFSMIGFRQCTLVYDRDIRFAGSTKYSLRKMVRFALDGIFSFSSSPVKFIGGLSLMLWSASLIYLFKSLVEHFIFKVTIQGWTSIIILLTFFTGIIIFCLSIIASYIGKIYEQGQGRPIYWLQDARNVDITSLDTDISEVALSKNIITRSDR